MIRLGDKVLCYPSIRVDYLGNKILDPVVGEVVYIHTKRRYYTVEFKWPGGGRYRESFRESGK
jgi:hypothetical protein